MEALAPAGRCVPSPTRSARCVRDLAAPHLSLDLLLVVLNNDELVTLTLLLDGGDDTPGSATGADDILVGDGEEVALLWS